MLERLKSTAKGLSLLILMSGCAREPLPEEQEQLEAAIDHYSDTVAPLLDLMTTVHPGTIQFEGVDISVAEWNQEVMAVFADERTDLRICTHPNDNVAGRSFMWTRNISAKLGTLEELASILAHEAGHQVNRDNSNIFNAGHPLETGYFSELPIDEICEISLRPEVNDAAWGIECFANPILNLNLYVERFITTKMQPDFENAENHEHAIELYHTYAWFWLQNPALGIESFNSPNWRVAALEIKVMGGTEVGFVSIPDWFERINYPLSDEELSTLGEGLRKHNCNKAREALIQSAKAWGIDTIGLTECRD